MSAKYDAAIEAIKQVHCDRSVSLVKCLENLRGLRDELDVTIDAVEGDIARMEALDE